MNFAPSRVDDWFAPASIAADELCGAVCGRGGGEQAARAGSNRRQRAGGGTTNRNAASTRANAPAAQTRSGRESVARGVSPSASRRRGLGWLLAGLLFAVGCLGWAWFDGDGDAALVSQVSPVAAAANSAAAASPADAADFIPVPIQDIRVGRRVRSTNPTGEEDLEFGADVDRATWKWLVFRAPKDDGGWADMHLLRPDWWLEAEAAAIGGTVYIAVPECGIDGEADVLDIRPCPAIQDGPGQVVTGTFRHRSAQVVDLRIEGLAEPIGTTANHPFWSDDRQAFVAARDLRPGERLADFAGNPRVVSIAPRPQPEAVYNLEVQVTHTYHVAANGVLVHNSLDDCYRRARLAALDAIDDGAMSVVSRNSRLIRGAANAEHHLLTKSRKSWFYSRYQLDVHDYVVDVDDLTHQVLHAGKSALNNRAGWWDHELMRSITLAEKRRGKLTGEQVVALARGLLTQFKLDHLKPHRYSKAPP